MATPLASSSPISAADVSEKRVPRTSTRRSRGQLSSAEISDSRWLKLRATRSSMLQLARAEISVSRLYRRSRSVSRVQAARAEMSATSFRSGKVSPAFGNSPALKCLLTRSRQALVSRASPHRARAEMSEMLLQLKSNVWIWVQRARAVMSSTRHHAKSAFVTRPWSPISTQAKAFAPGVHSPVRRSRAPCAPSRAGSSRPEAGLLGGRR